MESDGRWSLAVAIAGVWFWWIRNIYRAKAAFAAVRTKIEWEFEDVEFFSCQVE